MDLFCPTIIKSLSENRFVFILVDDFSQFTWVFFLEHKDQAFSHFQVFRKRVEKEKDFLILRIRSDEVVNLLTSPLSPIVKNMESNMNYHILELHNKMESLKGRIVLFKKWLG